MSGKGAFQTPGLVTGAAIAMAVLLMLALNVVPMANNDLWILLRVGEMIVTDHKIPDTVLFPFTAVRDNHFNAHEWLVSVIYHEFDHLWGLDSLIWIMGVFALVQFWLCVVLARRQAGSLGIALILASLAMVCANFRYVMRPELFALLFLVLLLLVLDRQRRERRWPVLLWAIPITVLWANCHGSFLLAPGICGLFALGTAWTTARAASGTPAQRIRAGVLEGLPFAVASVVMTAACALNPAGWSLLAFPFQLQKSELMRRVIKEWLPTFSPLFMAVPVFRVFMAIFIASLAVVIWLRRHLQATDVLLYAFFAALALERSRHIVWFGFIALYVCGRLLAHVRFERRRELQVQGAAAALAFAGFCACMAFGNVLGSHIYKAYSDNFDRAFIEELGNPAMSGNVFNSYELGGELIYRDWPRLKPFIDSRVDSYGDDYLAFDIRLLQDEAMLNDFLEHNHVNYMLLLWRDFRLKIHDMPSIHANWHTRLSNGDMWLLERNVHFPAEPATAAASAASAAR